MRRLRNISWETQIWVDTGLPDIWEITVNDWSTFPCDDTIWERLVEGFTSLFETVYTMWWWWEANYWSNIWSWIWVYSSKTWDALDFKSLIAWAWIEITGTATEITIKNTGEAETETQVNFWDNSTEQINVGTISTDRVVEISYSLEWGWNYQEWFMRIVHDWISADADHQYTWQPNIVDEVLYSFMIVGGNIIVQLQSVAVWWSLKFRYTKKTIKLAV